MTFKEYFCNGPCCKCNLHYIIGWILFLVGLICLLASFIYVNPFHIDFEPQPKNIFTVLIIIFGIFIIGIFSRCICFCYKKEDVQDYRESHRQLITNKPDLTYYN